MATEVSFYCKECDRKETIVIKTAFGRVPVWREGLKELARRGWTITTLFWNHICPSCRELGYGTDNQHGQSNSSDTPGAP